MARSSKKSAPAPATKDVALIYARSEDGRSYGVLRQRNDEIQVGTLRGLEEGKPIHGELVQLRPRPEAPMLFDVETTDTGTTPKAEPASGPPKVSTPAYREGWDSVWTSKRRSRELN